MNIFKTIIDIISIILILSILVFKIDNILLKYTILLYILCIIYNSYYQVENYISLSDGISLLNAGSSLISSMSSSSSAASASAAAAAAAAAAPAAAPAAVGSYLSNPASNNISDTTIKKNKRSGNVNTTLQISFPGGVLMNKDINKTGAGAGVTVPTLTVPPNYLNDTSEENSNIPTIITTPPIPPNTLEPQSINN